MLVHSLSDWCLWLKAAIHASVVGCRQCSPLLLYKAAEYARFGVVDPSISIPLLLEIAETTSGMALNADAWWRKAEDMRKDASAGNCRN